MSEKNKATKAELVKSQADYKGNSHFDLVKVTILKDTDFYKEGDTDTIHPTLAAIFKKQGIIGDYEKDVVKRDSGALMLTELEVQKVLEGEKEL